MPKFIGSHDDVVRTTTGHIVVFKAGVECLVPDDPVVIKLVKQAGHQPADKVKAPVLKTSTE
jgi:hypothetical protein